MGGVALEMLINLFLPSSSSRNLAAPVQKKDKPFGSMQSIGAACLRIIFNFSLFFRDYYRP